MDRTGMTSKSTPKRHALSSNLRLQKRGTCFHETHDVGHESRHNERMKNSKCVITNVYYLYYLSINDVVVIK